MANLDDGVKTSDADLQDELRRRLMSGVSVDDLANQIETLLKSFGKKRDRIEAIARRLARELAPQFIRRSNAIQASIKYRPKQLASLLSEATWDEIRTEVLPIIAAQKKVRATPKTEEERVRGIKIAKNRYERNRRRPADKPGWIERHFADQSYSLSLLNPLRPPSPSGPCLDEIFQGGVVKMCNDMYSLQSLFGLSRKKLSAAGLGTRRGRSFFYDYRAVLRCMEELLKQTGEDADWLPEPSRRRTVLTGILFRAKQEAKREIAAEFEQTLIPHLN